MTNHAAVIGLGPHGRRLVGTLTKMSGVVLAAVVDLRPDALAAEGIPADVTRYRSTDELWQHPNIDLVCIATNGPSHAELTKQAVAAGVKYVMVEKPMACSLVECDAMIAAAETAGARIAVDHIRVYADVYHWLRGQIASGAWGELRMVWMQRPGIGMGCNAVHSFAAVRYLADAEVRRVVGWVDEPRGPNPRGAQFTDPGGTVVLEMDRGIRAIVAQIEDGAGPASVEIHCTGARVRLDERSGEIEIWERDRSVKPGPDRPPVFNRTSPPPEVNLKADMTAMVGGCVRELLSDGPLRASALDGRATVELVVAAYLSQRIGNAPIDLPLQTEEARTLWLPIT